MEYCWPREHLHLITLQANGPWKRHVDQINTKFINNNKLQKTKKKEKEEEEEQLLLQLAEQSTDVAFPGGLI